MRLSRESLIKDLKENLRLPLLTVNRFNMLVRRLDEEIEGGVYGVNRVSFDALVQ